MEISTEELKKLIDSHGNFVLIDVRREDELHHGMIPNAKHLCLDEFEEAFELDENEFLEKYGFSKPKFNELVIVYCRTGSRSGVAADFLRRKGHLNVKNYLGSVQEWSKIDENVNMY